MAYLINTMNGETVSISGVAVFSDTSKLISKPCNKELAPDEWHRYLPRACSYLVDQLAPSDMAVVAALETLERTGAKLDQIDCVIAASQTPDYSSPGLANFAMAKLGMINVPGIELRHVNTGALQAIDIGEKLVLSGQNRMVLVVIAECMSRYFDKSHTPKNRNALLPYLTFADGAGSFLITSMADSDKLSGAKFEILKTSNQSTRFDIETCACDLPSVSRFPNRITAEDIQNELHYPHIDSPENLFDGLVGGSKVAFEKFVSGNPDLILSHQILNGINEKLAKQTGLSLEKFADSFVDFGFAGSAGAVRGLQIAYDRVPLGGTFALCALGLGEISQVCLRRV